MSHPQWEENSTPKIANHTQRPQQRAKQVEVGRTVTGASAMWRANRKMPAPTITSPANTHRHEA